MSSSKSDLYKYVEWLREQFEIDSGSYPINTIGLCNQEKNVELKYHSFNTNGFCGAILLGDKLDTIVLNSNRAPNEQNFDCGHEIVHGTKHRHKGIDCFSCMELKVKRKPNINFYEWEANEGSAEFLVPYRSLLPEIKEEYSHLKEWNDYNILKFRLSKKFNVTEAVINFRFESLKYEIQQYLNGASLNNLKILSQNQQKDKNISIKSLNDMAIELMKKEFERYHIDIIAG
ncbi:hypothetical protein A7X67_08250 [Clostridium sp. W14A]|nr:hypothetical protein A7X67_08250 [Clostridium sp. W14A]